MINFIMQLEPEKVFNRNILFLLFHMFPLRYMLKDIGQWRGILYDWEI